MVSTPKAPDPQATAQAQAGLNRDTAITQAQLNQTNQITPYGNLTYSQTGSAFSPSDTGQNYWYNASTGQYSQTEPKITGYSGGNTGKSSSFSDPRISSLNADSSYRANGSGQSTASGSSQGSPIYEQGWSQVKGNLTPQYTATTTLSPAQQQILDQTNGASLNLASLANDRSAFLKDYLGQQIDLSGAPALAGSGDFSADRQRVEDALMQRQQSSIDQNRDQLRTQLIASGIRPGTAAYSAEMARLGSTENDARLATILAGGQEQSRLANLQNSTRSQYMNEAYAQRNQPLQEISALMAGSQVQSPNFVQTPQTNVAGVDYTGLVNNQYNAQAKSAAATNGGIFGLLSAGVGLLSDRRAKENIVQVGTLDNGLPVYSYNYKGGTDTHIGVMADEVALVKPHAVNLGSDGFSRVRYDLAVEKN